jgi:hypothetical protein
MGKQVKILLHLANCKRQAALQDEREALRGPMERICGWCLSFPAWRKYPAAIRIRKPGL